MEKKNQKTSGSTLVHPDLVLSIWNLQYVFLGLLLPVGFDVSSFSEAVWVFNVFVIAGLHLLHY